MSQVFGVTQILLLIVVISQYYLTVGNVCSYTTFLSIELLLIYFYIVVYSILKWGFFDLYSLFLYTFGLFTFGEIIFSFFDPTIDFRVAYLGDLLFFKEETVQKALLVYSSFMLALDTGIKYIRNNVRCDDVSISFNIDLYRLGLSLMVIFVSFAFYRAMVQFEMLNSNRLLLFQGGSEGLGLPLYLRITSTFFLIGYYIFTASKPPLSHLLAATFVYVIVQIPDLMVGNRMALGVLFLYVIWMMVNVYKYKFNIKKLAITITLVLLVFQYVGMTRVDMEIGGIGFLGLIIKFLTMQATSFGLLCMYIQYAPNISGPYPFVLDSLIGGLTGYTGQTEQVLAHRASIGHQLVYEIDPDYYLSGASTGTSIVSELYEFDMVGIVLGAIFFAYMISFIINYICVSRLLLLFSSIIFSVVVISPRAGMFVPIYDIIRTLIFVWVAFKCYSLITGRGLHLSSLLKNEDDYEES